MLTAECCPPEIRLALIPAWLEVGLVFLGVMAVLDVRLALVVFILEVWFGLPDVAVPACLALGLAEGGL